MNYLTLCTRVYVTVLNIVLVISETSTSFGYQCVLNKYRTYDGTCNNLENPFAGASSTPYARILPPLENASANETIEEALSKLSAVQNVKKGLPSKLSGMISFWSKLLKLDLHQPSESAEKFINEATAYLDVSFLYGFRHEELFHYFREKDEIVYTPCSNCTGLLDDLIYRVTVAEHNRLSRILRAIYPEWSPEVLFEEVRRILIAEIQHITFNEYLPALLGKKVSSSLQKKYDRTVQTSIYASVADTILEILPEMGPSPTENSQNVAQTLLTSQATDVGVQFTDSTKIEKIRKLIENGRKHRFPSFQKYIQFCENIGYVTKESYSSHTKNQNSYVDFKSDDLLTGMFAELSQNSEIFGPVLRCLVVHQFDVIRSGDRFWYENDGFTKDQLSELQGVTLSGLLCSTLDNLGPVQIDGFSVPNTFLNTQVPCESLPQFNLVSWKQDSKNQHFVEQQQRKLLQDVIRKAEDDVMRRQQTEFLLWSYKGGVDPKSPIGIAAAFSKPNRQALLLANNSILLEYASRELVNILRDNKRKKRQLLDSDDTVIGVGNVDESDLLQELDVSNFVPTFLEAAASTCPTEVDACNPSYPYRSFTGYCNNLKKPNYGKSLTTFNRMLPPAYENGISKPRQKSVTGLPLPSARLISSMVHVDISQLNFRHSLMVMQFAQFLDHDITFTPVQRGFFASIPDCRPCDSPLTVHPECMPIHVPRGDTFYPQYNITSGQQVCLPFMRSLPGQQRLGAREQINQNSAFLDVSQVYGENTCMAQELRSHSGLLNVTVSPFGDKSLLPKSPAHPECRAESGYCFIAGDGRASEQPGLTAIHTIFMREHNRIATGLRSLNPHWDNERLFQEARRILNAQYQHVVYNEFLPKILGHEVMNDYGMRLEDQGYYKGYVEECDPGIVTEFATAAFRIGHSLLRPHIPRMSPTYYPVDPYILLRDTFFKPDIINQRYMVDEIIRGLAGTPMENLDSFITKEITNHLFEDKLVPHSGMDLPALNIQRARDHGIPSYNEFRAACNLGRANSWADLANEFSPDIIARFQRIYSTVDDIDLFPAGISERQIRGGLVGPTFACIIGIQFRRLRTCDRFWYETPDPLLKFTEPQLIEIRKASLSKLMCNNLDLPGVIQRSIFDMPNESQNPRLLCESIPDIDLSAWKETSSGCPTSNGVVPIGMSYLPSPCTSCICMQDGIHCASIRVTDCLKLIKEAGRQAVLKDDVCMSQCAEYVTFNPQSSEIVVDTIPPVNIRGKQINRFPTIGLKPPPLPPTNVVRPRSPVTRSFRFRDLAAAIIGI